MKHKCRQYPLLPVSMLLVITIASSRAWAQNTITTVAGGGANSPTALSAYIPQPTGVAVDLGRFSAPEAIQKGGSRP